MRSHLYRTIGPLGLERNLGVRAAMFFSRRNLGTRRYTIGKIDIDKEGDFCLRTNRYGTMVKIEHGDAIRLKIAGRGFNLIRNYIFIDDSD